MFFSFDVNIYATFLFKLSTAGDQSTGFNRCVIYWRYIGGPVNIFYWSFPIKRWVRIFPRCPPVDGINNAINLCDNQLFFSKQIPHLGSDSEMSAHLMPASNTGKPRSSPLATVALHKEPFFPNTNRYAFERSERKLGTSTSCPT